MRSIGPIELMFLSAILILPIIISVGIVYLMLRAKKMLPGETHCSKCDYIPRGLPEPRRPDCGARI